MSILVIAEHDNNELKGSTLNTVTAASEIGGDISILVAGSNSSTVAGQASSISGINQTVTKKYKKNLFKRFSFNWN